jgi:hemolysin III
MAQRFWENRPQVQAVSDDIYGQRPLLRGVLHLYAAIAAVAGAAVLLLVADSAGAYVGGAIFAASLILLYGTSAAYHRITWTPTIRGLIKRLDHSMIFVLIAGTYTPFCLVVLSLPWGITMLSVIWGLAGGGILLRIAWPNAPRWLVVSLYVILGWLALIGAWELAARLDPSPLVLLALGGAVYTLGGIVYATKRPDPWPRVFGYHEVFHLLVILGSVVHYSIVAIYVMPP